VAPAQDVEEPMWVLRSGYYKNFVKNYGKIGDPLISFLKKNAFV
jgi:hypothetical protein